MRRDEKAGNLLTHLFLDSNNAASSNFIENVCVCVGKSSSYDS